MIGFENMLDNLDVAIWVTDRTGAILYTNRSYQRLCGRSKEWYADKNAYELHEQGHTSVCPTRLVCQQKKRLHLVQHVYSKEIERSKDLLLLLTCTPIFDADGNVQYVLGDVVSIDKITHTYNMAFAKGAEIAYLDPAYGDEQNAVENMVAESPKMKEILEIAGDAASLSTNVLIQGESGTGKNVLASFIHKRSGRRDGPFIEINCAAIPENLIESELFGYERGAFTGAAANGKHGLIEDAHMGTLFLDEINSLPLNLQGKLLQAVETKTIRRLGSSQSTPVDFRLIAASNANLFDCVCRGGFREDLFYRLNVISFLLPPLRERKEDIIPLCLAFLDTYCKNYGRTKVLSPTVYNKITEYGWPGNIRELKNFVERIVVTTRKEDLYINDIADSMFQGQMDGGEQRGSEGIKPVIIMNLEEGTRYTTDFSLPAYLDHWEERIVAETLKQCKNTYQAAKMLGISQPSIMRLKKKYQIEY